jgi:GNAT superfamily N-acetyltransferase
MNRYLPGDQIPGFDASLLPAQLADEHFASDNGAARCSIWWNHVPALNNERLGVIGHFHADSADAGAGILEHAVSRLRKQGCSLAVGPMDGNTWRRYRVLTERGDEPPFFMEPDNPDFWPVSFAAAQFSPLATYSSSLVSDLSQRDPRMERTWERLLQSGVTIRNLDPDRYEDDLRRIYQVSRISFTANFLYTEIPEAAFLAQYLPYREKIRKELVMLAECDGEPVGYLFAIPDYAEALRGEPIRTVIGKTLAILPDRIFGGLGVVLVNMLHERAQALGYSRLIHALQNESNQVRNLSGAFGGVIRRYTLYSRRLA